MWRGEKWKEETDGRIVAELMESFGARSRFQAGVIAARLGLLDADRDPAGRPEPVPVLVPVSVPVSVPAPVPGPNPQRRHADPPQVR